MIDAIDLTSRSRHDAIEIVEIKTGVGGRTKKGCIRVSTDARLMEMLEEIGRAHV